MAEPTPGELLDLHGRVAVITGASGGVGAGIARRFAAAGALTVVHYRSNAAAASALCAELGQDALALQADLTRSEDVERLMGAAVEAFGRLDVLVNNAGVQPVADLLEMTPEQWDAVVAGNLRMVFLCTQAAARRMRGSGCGAIVNIASIEGEQPARGHSHYTAAKAGVLQYTRAAACELGRYGIRVNAVSPGLIARPGIEEQWPEGVRRWRAAAPLERLGEPADVGDACVFLASPAARWISGANLRVDGGVLAGPTW